MNQLLRDVSRCSGENSKSICKERETCKRFKALERLFKAMPLDIVRLKEVGGNGRVLQIRITAGAVWYNIEYWMQGILQSCDLHGDDFEVITRCKQDLPTP